MILQPQLGGNLDVVTHSIVSTSNRDINLTPNGTGKVVIGTNGLEFGDGTVQTTVGGAGGSGESVSWSVTQTSHGLAVGDVIYNNGTNYVKAQANATGTLGLFVVSIVADANTFTATFSGKITLSSLTMESIILCQIQLSEHMLQQNQQVDIVIQSYLF